MMKDRYRALFERSADANLIISNGRFIDCNEATVQMLRYRSKDDLLNTHPSQLSPPTQPDGRLSFEKANDMMAIAFTKGSHRFEWNHLRSDGEVFPVEVLLTAVEDEENHTLHVVWREISDRKQAEEDLLRLTSIVESTSDLVSTATLDGQITYINRAGSNMLGWASGENLSGKQIADIHPPWAFKLILDRGLPEAMQKGLWLGETAVQALDGSEIPVSQVIMYHATRTGKKAFFSTIMRDISHRKKAEIFLNSIIDTVGDPIFVKDNLHRFVVLNKSFCDFTGYSRKMLLGKSDFDFFPAEQAEVFRNRDEQVLQSGQENINEEVITDSVGRIHTISTRKTSFVDSKGDRFLVGVIRDISELKQAQRQLQENLNLLHSIVENQPTCVKLVNRHGQLLEMNPAGLAMIAAQSREIVIGRKVYDLVDEKDRQQYIDFNQAVCSGEKRQLRFAIHDLNGEIHYMETVAVPLQYGPQGETVQLGITRDITEDLALQAEQEILKSSLRQSQKMEAIGTLAGGIAHDFNNILSAILGYAELALLTGPKEGALRSDISQILKAGQRAKDLVSQILTFSRKTDQEYKPLRICQIVKETLKLLRASLPATITIEQQIASDCPPILADPTQIQQLVMNVCTNAFHAMRDHGGLLTVSVSRRTLPITPAEQVFLDPNQGYLELRISDTGCGMDKEIMNRIFEPYFTTKNKGEGTGLGLSVVHGIVRSYGGHISADSTPGIGTVFRIFLPYLEVDEQEDTAQLPPPPGGTESVLVVDDEPMLVEICGRLLKNLGYQVTTVTSSELALQLFTQTPDDFHLLITDLTMPALTGAELANEIHKIRPYLPIIICTGYSSSGTQNTLADREFVETIAKPVHPTILATAVRKALDRH